MSEAVSLLQVVDEWATDRIVAAAIDHPSPLVLLAVLPDVICSELVRRCHLTRSTASEIAAAITGEVTGALMSMHEFATVH